MPDEAKFRSLQDAGFEVNPTCGRCGYFVMGANGWGVCRVISYEHGKHTGAPRFASVPYDGRCPQHVDCNSEISRLGAHSRFYTKDRNG